jgi:GrpB-like predicted nucleotidyltransferase (UPF0157 family)
MPHHLYVCPAESLELRRYIAFRDALRARAEWRGEYERLKRAFADRAGAERQTYTQIKEVECHAFVERILSEGPNPALPPAATRRAARGG